MRIIQWGVIALFAAASVHAGSLALVCSEGGSSDCAGVQEQMQATGAFSTVDTFDSTSSTPTLAQISGYNAVLAWTNETPSDPTALGDLLASYYDLGGRALTLATYAFSDPWSIAGNIMTGGYAGLTNLGTNGSVSGGLVATVPGDPIFSGIDLPSLTYGSNSNYAIPGLGTGATLLATDGAGVNMIARSSLGVIDVNIWPANESDNAEFFDLLANTLDQTPESTTPEPATWALLGVGLSAIVVRRRKIGSTR